ncbi:recombinase family protein [Elusimicrobiota bacterium]
MAAFPNAEVDNETRNMTNTVVSKVIHKRFRGSIAPPKPEERVLRTACYVRVSTEEQARHGFSIAAQKERLGLICKSEGWNVSDFYVDDGYSGKDLGRPAMEHLRRNAISGKFDIVLVYKLDRLSRRVKDLVTLAEEFKKLNVGLRSATEPFDTTNPAGTMFFNMLGSFAQFERELIGERTKMGLRRRLKEGKWNGPSPFGFSRTEEGILKHNPVAMPWAKRVFELYRNHDLGIKEIARKLNKEDTVTTRQKAWCKNSVWNILTQPVYAGYIYIEGELHQLKHEPISTLEEWKSIQVKLRRRSFLPPWKTRSPNILTGLVFCGKCGNAMTTGKGTGRLKEKYYYYVCTGRPDKCDMPYIPSDALEIAVFDEIRKIANMPEMIEVFLGQYRIRIQERNNELCARRVSLQKKIEAAQRIKNERTQWFIQNVKDKEVAEIVGGEIKNQLNILSEAQKELSGVEETLGLLASKDVTPEAIAHLLKNFDKAFDKLEVTKRRKHIQILVKDVVVLNKAECRATLRIPLPAKKPVVKKPKPMPIALEYSESPSPRELLQVKEDPGSEQYNAFLQPQPTYPWFPFWSQDGSGFRRSSKSDGENLIENPRKAVY